VPITKKLKSNKVKKTILNLLMKEEPEKKEKGWIKMLMGIRFNQ
jgi:hypothetical protein